MVLPTLTLQQARLVNLAVQGLLSPPRQSATKMDVLAAIRRMGVLQIDTISVVARSPYLVLFSRLGQYDPQWLDELLAEKRLFEQWAHAACFIPMDDYPLFRRLCLEGHRESYFAGWAKENRQTVDHVLEVVRQEGARKSADFESEKGPGGWWNWKIEKAALEFWFARGDLMVARRDNFQRVYDLRERVLPGWSDENLPAREEVEKQLILMSVRAMGIAHRQWVWDYYPLKKKPTFTLIDQLTAEGALRKVSVEDWQEPALYVPEDESLVLLAADNGLEATHTTLLSPFDPVTWDRERTRQLYGFDFTIQAYTPAAKRRFGYFPLPILHKGALVGRLDAKAHRKEGVFEVRNWYLEPGIQPSGELSADIRLAVQRCADWHNTPQVEMNPTSPII